MPVRVSRYRELCSICRDPTDSVCFRCKTPLCGDHAPTADRRCAGCEREYNRWPSREPRVLAIGALLALAWIAVTVALLESMTPVAVGWALGFPVIVAPIALRRLDSGRAIFLRQEKRDRAAVDKRRFGV